MKILSILSIMAIATIGFSMDEVACYYGGGVYFEKTSGNVLKVYTNGTAYQTIQGPDIIPMTMGLDGLVTSPTNLDFYFVASSNLVDVYPSTSTNLPVGAKTNISQIIRLTRSDMTNIWQSAKSPMLKAVENIYVDFVTNDWTKCLRSANIISSNSTITVQNTPEAVNMQYLMALRTINKATYYNMAGEFQRFKETITGYGGVMALVEKH